MTSANIFLFLAIVSAFCAWYSTREDSKQKDRIEELGKTNNELTTKVENLATINNSIVTQNSELTKHNIELTNTATELASHIQMVTRDINIRTKNEFAQNAIVGQLKLNLGVTKEPEYIDVSFGGVKFSMPPSFVDVFSLLRIDGKIPFTIKVVGGELLISFVIYDLKREWIAEITDNYWRRNPTNIGKFNYDDKGFEVIDFNNNVALSIDILSPTHIKIQGIIFPLGSHAPLIIGKEGMITVASQQGVITYNDIDESIKKVNLTPIFKYSGKNWLGQRL